MDEHINRKGSIEFIREKQCHRCSEIGSCGGCAVLVALKLLEEVPAADVRPNVRGHWIGEKEAEEMGDILKEFTCSVCGCCDWDCTESESFNFCPNCGADMRSHEVIVKGKCTACGKQLGEDDGLFLCAECQEKNNEETR